LLFISIPQNTAKCMSTTESGRTVTHRTKNEYNLHDKIVMVNIKLKPY